MSTCDGPESQGQMTLWDWLVNWWKSPCKIFHRWGPWKARPCQGFDITWRLVAGVEYYRYCRRCRRLKTCAKRCRSLT